MRASCRFCGLTRNLAGSSKNTVLRSSPSNWTFRYDSKPGKWYQIQRHPDSPPNDVPVPRFAHQAVYHAPTRTVFLHGGNAGGLSALERERSTSANGNLDGNTGSARPTPSPPDEGAQTQPQSSQIPPNLGTTTASASQTSEPRQDVITEAPPTEKRLDDFWMMKLRRSILLTLLFLGCNLTHCDFIDPTKRKSFDKPNSRSVDSSRLSSHSFVYRRN